MNPTDKTVSRYKWAKEDIRSDTVGVPVAQDIYATSGRVIDACSCCSSVKACPTYAFKGAKVC